MFPSSSKPLRVAHVITRMSIGGAQEHALLTVAGLAKDPGFAVHLITGVDDGAEGDMLGLARSRVPLTVVPEMRRNVLPFADLVALWKLYRLMRRERFDVVHTHLAKAGILGRLAAKIAGTPLVVHNLHGMVFHDYQPWLINRACWVAQILANPLTDHYVTVSEVVGDKAVESGIGSRESFSTIYTGMELDWFLDAQVDTGAVRQEFGIPEGVPVVGMVARMAPVKNHAQFLEMAPGIIRQVPDARFLLVGDGPLQADLQRQAVDLGIAGNVVFTGMVPRERVPDLMAIMDVLAHTALYEGLPRVFVQALAMGKPCVAFDADGTREVVISGETGYVVPIGDGQAMASNIIKLLADPQLRLRMGEAGKHLVDPQFRVETMVEQTGALYQRLLAAKMRKR